MTKIKHQGRILNAEVRVKATPQQAWEAWAQPERVKDWFVDDASGDPKSGEMMTWVWKSYGMNCPLKVLESVPAERFVVEWPMPQGAIVWEIDIQKDGAETLVKIVSSGFGDGAAWDEQYEGQKHGWPICVAIYKAYVEGHFGRRRRDIVLLRPLERPVDLYPYMSDAKQLTRWIAREAEIEGKSIRLTLKDGRKWTGRLLVDSGRELCFSVDEIGGLVTLKALGGCGEAAKMAGLHVSGWRLSEAEANALEKTLGQAVDGLIKTVLSPAHAG